MPVPYLWEVNIVSGNGLVPSDNKRLLELVLTETYVAICRQLKEGGGGGGGGGGAFPWKKN